MAKRKREKRYPRIETCGGDVVIISRSNGRYCRTKVHKKALAKVIAKRAERFPKEYSGLLTS